MGQEWATPRRAVVVALTVGMIATLAWPPRMAAADTTEVVMAAGSTWRYDDSGTDLGTAWREPGYDDAAWSEGPGQLGFGDGDEATVTANNGITTYFRKAVTITDVASVGSVDVGILRDDGAVIYINGIEAARTNMPAGAISFSTLAPSVVNGAAESVYHAISVESSLLVEGTNVVAVEVHNNSVSSSDISFDLSMSVVKSDVPPPPDEEGTLVATAGDIALCNNIWDELTSDAIDTVFAERPGIVLMLGDAAYPNGTAEQFQCYDDSWGRHKAYTYPILGNHEYDQPGAGPYFDYFEGAAGDRALGYYSFAIDEHWHAIMLNSNCSQIAAGGTANGCAAGSPQEQWLRGDLAANGHKNLIVALHHPRWTSNQYTDHLNVAPLVNAVHEYGADILLAGHEHHYERYRPLNGAGQPDELHGMRQFIVGSGGVTLRSEVRPASPNSVTRQFTEHGILELELFAESYTWRFVPVAGGVFSDVGSSAVVDPPPAAAYDAVVLSDTPVAYWRLGESAGTSALDSAGSVVGTYANGVTLGVPGLVAGNTAASFDGVNDVVRIPDSGLINLRNRRQETIEAWFRADTTTNRAVIVEQGGTSRGLNMYVEGGSLYFGGWNTVNDPSADTPWASGPAFVSTPISAGVTYHAVLVYDADADALRGYLDGVLVGTVTGIGQLYNHAADTGIGAMNDGTRFVAGPFGGAGFSFDGTIDEVAIYNAALSASRVAAHHAAGVGEAVNASPTVAFQEPAAGSVVSGTVAVRLLAADAETAPASLTVEVSADGGATWVPAVYDDDSGVHGFDLDTTALADGALILTGRVADGDGGVATTDVSVSVSNVAEGDYGPVVAADNPTAWWRLGESGGTAAADSAGTATGSYTGGVTLGWAGLVAGPDTAARFDGVNDRVAIPNTNLINLGPPRATHSVELWFEATDVTRRQVLFEQGGVTRGLSMYLDGGRFYGGAWNTANDPSTDTPWVSGPAFVSAPVTVGARHHAVVVLDQPSGALVVYLDGVEVGRVSGVGLLYAHGSDGSIGSAFNAVRFHTGAVNGNGFFFGGVIDEVAIYRRALDAATVATHHQAG